MGCLGDMGETNDKYEWWSKGRDLGSKKDCCLLSMCVSRGVVGEEDRKETEQVTIMIQLPSESKETWWRDPQEGFSLSFGMCLYWGWGERWEIRLTYRVQKWEMLVDWDVERMWKATPRKPISCWHQALLPDSIKKHTIELETVLVWYKFPGDAARTSWDKG